MTDDSDERRSEHEQIHAMTEGAKKDLAIYMHQHCHFPHEPVCQHNDDDDLIALRFRAGGSFYQDKTGKIVFMSMTDDEISATVWPPRWPPKHERADFVKD